MNQGLIASTALASLLALVGAGQAKSDNDPGEWQFVAKGSCSKLGGMSAADAKKKADKKK